MQHDYSQRNDVISPARTSKSWNIEANATVYMLYTLHNGSFVNRGGSVHVIERSLTQVTEVLKWCFFLPKRWIMNFICGTHKFPVHVAFQLSTSVSSYCNFVVIRLHRVYMYIYFVVISEGQYRSQYPQCIRVLHVHKCPTVMFSHAGCIWLIHMRTLVAKQRNMKRLYGFLL